MATQKQLATLDAIVDRLEYILDTVSLLGGDRQEIARRGWAGFVEAKNFRRIGCRNLFELLFGHRPSPAESASHARTIRQLVAAGLIEAHRPNGSRITHVKLTADGFSALISSLSDVEPIHRQQPAGV